MQLIVMYIKKYFIWSIVMRMGALTISPFGPAGPDTPAGPIRPFEQRK